MEKDIQKNYEELKKKYKLPEFNLVDSEFEISTIENDIFLLREIRKKIIDKIETFCKLLEELIQPESTSLSTMHEVKVFEDEEKEKIYTLFKMLMKFHRTGFLLAINDDDKKEAQFINDVMAHWKEIKADITKIVEKLRDSWDKDLDIQEKVGYLG